MNKIADFGEQIDGYAVKVLNERAVRASAGILFFFAIVSFMNAWLTGNFQPTRVFVVVFLVDFTIRIFINPRFAPSLIVGHWFVRKQQPEYVGAPQKRVAWAIGFGLALTMLYLVVINQIVGPINLFVCAACLTLLFFETAFGICIGCKVYNLFNRDQAQLCPGNACDVSVAPASTAAGFAQGAIVLAFAALAVVVTLWDARAHSQNTVLQIDAVPSSAPIDPAEAERCKVPEFAKAMGHEEKWKLHNNCK